MKKNDTVIFDLDDVIVKDAFVEFLKEFMKNGGRIITDEEIREAKCKYCIEKEIIKDERLLNKFYKTLLDVDIYDYGVVDEDAMKLIERISNIGEVFIATSPLMFAYEKVSGKLYERKYNFLVKTFPFLDPKNFILGGNKSILNAKYFIDDRLENLSGNSRIKVLYDADHNQNYSFSYLYEKGIIRIPNMKELEKCMFAEHTLKEMKKIIKDTFYNIFHKTDIYDSHKAFIDENENKEIQIFTSNLVDRSPYGVDLEMYLEKLLGQEVEIVYNK